jgi:hypothetical protein
MGDRQGNARSKDRVLKWCGCRRSRWCVIAHRGGATSHIFPASHPHGANGDTSLQQFPVRFAWYCFAFFYATPYVEERHESHFVWAAVAHIYLLLPHLAEVRRVKEHVNGDCAFQHSHAFIHCLGYPYNYIHQWAEPWERNIRMTSVCRRRSRKFDWRSDRLPLSGPCCLSLNTTGSRALMPSARWVLLGSMFGSCSAAQGRHVVVVLDVPWYPIV